MYVNTGLIKAAGNTSELAAVMAHEIGHGVSRHATERVSKVYGVNLGAGLLLGENASTLKKIAAQIAAGGLVASPFSPLPGDCRAGCALKLLPFGRYESSARTGRSRLTHVPTRVPPSHWK